MTHEPTRSNRGLRLLAAGVAGVLLLGACATPPSARRYPVRAPVAATPPPPPAIYPARGQSDRQLARDRYECYQWAVRESGFDPARSIATAPQPSVRVEPDPPSGVGTATGVLAGAAIGAAVSNSRHNAEGAAVGALLGGIVGAASDSARSAEAARIERDLNRQSAAQATYDARGTAYQRAFSACLEGRGYTVR
ncbi:MAG: hypothetical protein KDH20_07455 [Rhodocyclaceae bacterium]|nr:hypothetical protein [Rhodocyclaceae bacterium]